MDGVVDARVKRTEAANQVRIGGVDDRVGLDGRDVSLPQRKRWSFSGASQREAGEGADIRDRSRGAFSFEHGIDRGAHLFGQGGRVANCQQRAKQFKATLPSAGAPMGFAKLVKRALVLQVIENDAKRLTFTFKRRRLRRERFVERDEAPVGIEGKGMS